MTVPYHNYGASALIIWGAADAEWVRERIQGPWEPVLGKDGRAQVSIWVVDYRDTNLNPYQEVIVTFCVAHRHRKESVRPVEYSHQLLQMLEDKEIYGYIYKLWLDEQLPVDYGRELLGCDKYLDPGMTVDIKGKAASFVCHHVPGERNREAAEPELLLKAELTLENKTHLSSLIGSFGIARTLGMASGVRTNWHVVNPAGVMDRPDSEKYNPVWTAVFETSPKFTTARKTDKIEFGETSELRQMNFVPSLYQADDNLRAVLLPAWSFSPVDSAE